MVNISIRPLPCSACVALVIFLFFAKISTSFIVTIVHILIFITTLAVWKSRGVINGGCSYNNSSYLIARGICYHTKQWNCPDKVIKKWHTSQQNGTIQLKFMKDYVRKLPKCKDTSMALYSIITSQTVSTFAEYHIKYIEAFHGKPRVQLTGFANWLDVRTRLWYNLIIFLSTRSSSRCDALSNMSARDVAFRCSGFIDIYIYIYKDNDEHSINSTTATCIPI